MGVLALKEHLFFSLQDYEGKDIDSLCETLKKLATDSNKHRAKKDRRQQRSSFRDVLRAVEVSSLSFSLSLSVSLSFSHIAGYIALRVALNQL